MEKPLLNPELDSKICEVFGQFAIDKTLVRKLGVSGDDRHVPSYVMDWIVTYLNRTSSDTRELQSRVADFVTEHLPSKGDKELVKFKLGQGDVLTILDAVSVKVRLGREIRYEAAVPSLDEKSAAIDGEVVKQNPSLLQGSTWGAVKLCNDDSGQGSGIRIIEFKAMQTGRVSLTAFKQCRERFSLDEWIDVIVRTMGYEPSEYSESEKVWLICRLLPLVQNRLNMMELAPPGSGKSYVFNNVSRHAWLTTANISPAVLFYNRNTKQPGLLTRYDLLVLDEAQSIRFTEAAEIQAQLKGYLEQGVFARGDVIATAECGMMLLANISLREDPGRQYKNGRCAFVPERSDYIRVLPEVFQESPLIDRFHGIIPGWEIPLFRTQQEVNGFGLKTDYFSEVLHRLRSASEIPQAVRAHLGLSGGKRDCTAIERMTAALAKLLQISPKHDRFDELVYSTAEQMRSLVRSQLHAVDPHGYRSRLDVKRKTDRSAVDRLRHYELLEEIGRGGMAVVYKCLDTESDTVVALKKVAPNGAPFDERAIQREIDIYHRLLNLDSPHVLKVRDVFREGDVYALVTELADGGTLMSLIMGDQQTEKTKPLESEIVRAIMLEICEGVRFLHENDIVHRDIKPQNIMKCDDQWKLGDFGISKRIDKPVTGYTFQGAYSPNWAPPEQIAGVPADPSADVYALGRVALFLLTGSESANVDDAPSDWRTLLNNCLDMSPDKRPTAEAMMLALEKL